MLTFELDDLTRPAVVRLLEEHLEDMYATSPADSVHALDLDALRAPGIALWTAWEGETLCGSGALKTLEAGRVELKSMRTPRHARGRGFGGAILDHLLAEAKRAGAHTVLLETGSQEFFIPARTLYGARGFVERGPFDDYVEDPNSVYLELTLGEV